MNKYKAIKTYSNGCEEVDTSVVTIGKVFYHPGDKTKEAGYYGMIKLKGSVGFSLMFLGEDHDLSAARARECFWVAGNTTVH